MKKIKIVFLILFLILNFSCNKEKKVINVGIYADYPPFSFKENDQIKGFNLEFLNICLKNLNYKPNYIEVDIDSFDKLKNGEIDILVGGYPITYKYPEGVSLTEPYFDMSVYLMSRIDDPLDSLESLSDRKLILPMYTFLEEVIKSVKNLEKIPYKNFNESIKSLKERDADAILVEKVILDIYSLDEKQFLKVKLLDQGLTIVLREDDDELRYELNSSISLVKKSKQYKKLILKWFEEE